MYSLTAVSTVKRSRVVMGISQGAVMRRFMRYSGNPVTAVSLFKELSDRVSPWGGTPVIDRTGVYYG